MPNREILDRLLEAVRSNTYVDNNGRTVLNVPVDDDAPSQEGRAIDSGAFTVQAIENARTTMDAIVGTTNARNTLRRQAQEAAYSYHIPNVGYCTTLSVASNPYDAWGHAEYIPSPTLSYLHMFFNFDGYYEGKEFSHVPHKVLQSTKRRGIELDFTPTLLEDSVYDMTTIECMVDNALAKIRAEIIAGIHKDACMLYGKNDACINHKAPKNEE